MRRKPKYLDRERREERRALMRKLMAQVQEVEERRAQAGLNPKTKITRSEWEKVFAANPWMRPSDKAWFMDGRVLDG